MFNLNKSLSKLKSMLENANMSKHVPASNGDGKFANKENEKIDIAKKKPTNRSKPNRNSQKEKAVNEKHKHGVIMIKNFPHGFYERQMFDYFSQFGEVTRLKIVRSRKTGNPRSYGFVEFQFEHVAKIAAETMDNYIIFDHIIKCKFLPEEKVPKNLFQNWNRPFISSVKSHKDSHNRNKSDAKEYDLLCKRLKRIHRMEKVLTEKGIDFKCVMVNRPTDLRKPNKTARLDSKSGNKNKKRSLYKEKQKQVLPLKPTIGLRTSKSKLRRHRNWIVPRLMILKAGFNYKV